MMMNHEITGAPTPASAGSLRARSNATRSTATTDLAFAAACATKTTESTTENAAVLTEFDSRRVAHPHRPAIPRASTGWSA